MARKPEIALGGVAYLAAILSIAAVWQGSALFLPSFLLPGIPEVFRRLLSFIPTGEFLTSLGISFLRLWLGFTAAVLAGTALGLASGLFPWLRRYLRALVSILQSIPPITWVPLLVILLGFGNLPIIIVIGMAGFYPMVQNVMNAAEHVDELHLKVARVLGAGRRQQLTTVYLPEVFPSIVTGMQISFGNAWRALVAAEMVAGVSIGLGWSITYSAEIADMAGVLGHILIIGSIAALIDRAVLESIKHRLLKWRYIDAQ